MVELVLSIRKSLEENAADYFEKAKKAKKKITGLKQALERFEAEKTTLEQKKLAELQKEHEKQEQKTVKREKKWYEKFRWFISSEGFLCIGGRDATTNEIIIKKHTEPNDIVFHTEAPGSPFFVIKTQGRTPGEATLSEAAEATASYSRAWKLGITATDVYSVAPEQVSKTAKSGEYLAKGAFVIYGKRKYYRPSLQLAVGMTADGIIMGGPPGAVRKNCQKFVIIKQGGLKASDAAKKIQKLIGGEIDEIIQVLPAGGVQVHQQ